MNHLRFAAWSAIALVAFTTACSSSSSGAGAPDDGGASFPSEALSRTPSDSGALVVELRSAPEQPPTRGNVSVELTVLDAAGQRIDGLTVDVVPFMPAMGHGTSVHPTVTAEGNGRYRVSDVYLAMPGNWELRTTFTGARQDHATPTLQIL